MMSPASMSDTVDVFNSFLFDYPDLGGINKKKLRAFEIFSCFG